MIYCSTQANSRCGLQAPGVGGLGVRVKYTLNSLKGPSDNMTILRLKMLPEWPLMAFA